MIKEVNKDILGKALNLVNEVFSEFVTKDYSEQGRNTFENYLKIKYDEVMNDISEERKKIWAYCKDDEIIGVIATRDTFHISLMFVDKRYHRKGIARQMFRFVLNELSQQTQHTRQSDTEMQSGTGLRITVNSSPYAVPVYEHLGFVKTAEQQEKDGIIFIPMAYTPENHTHI